MFPLSPSLPPSPPPPLYSAAVISFSGIINKTKKKYIPLFSPGVWCSKSPALFVLLVLYGRVSDKRREAFAPPLSCVIFRVLRTVRVCLESFVLHSGPCGLVCVLGGRVLCVFWCVRVWLWVCVCVSGCGFGGEVGVCRGGVMCVYVCV